QRDVTVPHRVHGRDIPAHIGAIDDVVMDEGRGVHELERLGEVEHRFAVVARPEARRQEDERGPEKLSRGLEDVLDRRLERRMATAAYSKKPSFQLLELRLNGRVER